MKPPKEQLRQRRDYGSSSTGIRAGDVHQAAAGGRSARPYWQHQADGVERDHDAADESCLAVDAEEAHHDPVDAPTMPRMMSRNAP